MMRAGERRWREGGGGELYEDIYNVMMPAERRDEREEAPTSQQLQLIF